MDDDSDVSMASSAPTTKKKAPAKKAATTKSAAKGKGKAVDLVSRNIAEIVRHASYLRYLQFNESDSEEDSEASTSRGKKA